MNHNRPFVDPNDRYSYEDWMNEMANKEPSKWFTDSPEFHNLGFDDVVEAVLEDGRMVVGTLSEEEYYTDSNYWWVYTITVGPDEVIQFLDVATWRFV